MSQSTSGRIHPGFFVVLLVALLAFGWVMVRTASVEPEVASKPDASGPAEMTEEERVAYVAQFIKVNDLAIGPDMKPDRDEPVPGLMRVTGILVNTGERKISKVNLSVYPQDESGKVLGSHIENVVGSMPLKPGQSRDFKFQIPEKKAYGGTFKHKLH